MVSVFIVLSTTIFAINMSNYMYVENEANAVLVEVLKEGINIEVEGEGGEGPGGPGGGDHPGGDDPRARNRLEGNHYYIVAFSSQGVIEKSDYRHIFSLSESEGNLIAIKIYNGELSGGKYDNFRYIKEVKSDGYTYIAVLDNNEKLADFYKFLTLSTTISIGAYLALFALIFIASYIAFKPSVESYKKQKQFITNASHELKTPLTIISTDLDILEMDHGKSEWSESIRDQVSRLTSMTNQLVTLSKLDENDLKNYPFSDFSINDVIKKAVDYFAPSFNQARIEFVEDIQDDIIYYGNKYLFEELCYIFLDNSLKYTGGKFKTSSIELAKDKKDHFHIIFSNTIDEDDEIDPSQVTERFYRSPTNKKEGSGIGLSIAKEIVNLHKGKLDTKKDNNSIYFKLYF